MGGGAILPAISTADRRAKAFDVLADATKQMITVGSGIVTTTDAVVSHQSIFEEKEERFQLVS
jgi:hypothetical protein